MPIKFDKCVAEGGKVITKDVNPTQYMHICFPKGGGPSIAGDVKTKKSIKRFVENK